MPSDISSAGIARVASGYGSTSRKDVLRRVEVPVVPGAAVRTRPVPGGKLQLSEPMPTGRARLAGRVPTVDHNQRPTGTGALVLQLSAEFAPSRIGDGSSEAAIADHVPHRQVLDRDHVCRAHKSCGGAVQEVFARVTDLAVCTSDLELGFAAIAATFPAPGQSALVASEFSRFAGQVRRIGDTLPVTGHQEAGQPEIHADGVASGSRWRDRRGVHGERHVPAAIRLTGNHDHRGVRCGGVQVEGPDETQWRAGSGQRQHSVTHPERRAGVVRALTSDAGLESRVTGSSGEEVHKRGVLVTQSLLQGHGGHFRQEREFLGALPCCQSAVGFPVRGAYTLGSVAQLTLAQRLVPRQTHTPENTVQGCGLVGSRVGAALVRRPHATQHPGSTMACKTMGWWAARRATGPTRLRPETPDRDRISPLFKGWDFHRRPL
ncbi:hypothetical protein SAMN04488564_103772 [Lentzea waywayandensis]|uniref:Uncharacterized protein n=1 Tax=Lentzea waywayandensis TaxID=84724 RepID=A0A1I6E3D9_9PSEU|nr:hypothetical protein SAMN04488564_103772 [Lentzea waywayandensis]